MLLASRLLIALFSFVLCIFAIRGDCECATDARPDCPEIKWRHKWGSNASDNNVYRPIPVKRVVIHHTVTPECNSFEQCSRIVRNMQAFHLNTKKYQDIAYNFLIGDDGLVYEGTGWHVAGSHTYGYNRNGTGIAFIGDFSAKLPSSKALDAAKHLLKCGVENGALDTNYELYAASQVISTQSPGLTLYNEIQEWDHWSPNP
ncbi:peptidoglycan-recognition protein SA-like isoform X2 [Musca autumnalis]|uniref:peptidoglycan-recognition protein SA-like isoform X2 n=1 Tax=Musca autumnalis TaxID=221902 RepID=UPI003CEE57A0